MNVKTKGTFTTRAIKIFVKIVLNVKEQQRPQHKQPIRIHPTLKGLKHLKRQTTNEHKDIMLCCECCYMLIVYILGVNRP